MNPLDFEYLYISDSKIMIYQPMWDSQVKYTLEKRVGKIVNRNYTNYEIALVFIKCYEKIREILIDRLESDTKTKQGFFEAIDKVNKKYNKDAEIEIDFPETLNKHSIEVQEAKGKKIGVINFGDRTIKIITTGDIVLIDKEEIKEKQEPSSKTKKKIQYKRTQRY